MTPDIIAALEALKPFAAEAAEYDIDYGSDYGGSRPDFRMSPDASSLNEINDLTVGDLRRARQAYAALSTSPAGQEVREAVYRAALEKIAQGRFVGKAKFGHPYVRWSSSEAAQIAQEALR